MERDFQLDWEEIVDAAIGRRKERQLLTGDVPSPANPPQACRFHTRCFKMQEVCAQEEPLLESKGTANLAACHFPLTEEEVRLRLPAALTVGRNGSGDARSAGDTIADQSYPSSSSST